MTSVALQKPLGAGQGSLSHRVVGPVTGNVYIVDGLGRVVLDTQDAPGVLAKGWLYANIEDLPNTPRSGTAVLDFGAFPGTPLTETTVTASDIFDPSAVLMTWVSWTDSTDHSADEHAVDPPLVSGQVSGNTIILRATARGTDIPLPPVTQPGNKATSQQPLPQPEHMPYGKWNVNWAFLQ